MRAVFQTLKEPVLLPVAGRRAEGDGLHLGRGTHVQLVLRCGGRGLGGSRGGRGLALLLLGRILQTHTNL